MPDALFRDTPGLASGLRVRHAEPADGPAMWSMFDALARAAGFSIGTNPADLAAAYFGPGAEFMAQVADAGERVIGVAAYSRMRICSTLTTWAHVQSFYVEAGWRGRGVGTRLLEAVRADAAARGWSGVRLETTADNAPAIRFYEARGMAPLPQLRRFMLAGR